MHDIVLFKNFITDFRPQVDIDRVATGEVWYGQRAIDHQLIDEVKTSDSYLLEKRDSHDLYLIGFEEKQTLQQKLGLAAKHTVTAAIEAISNKEQATAINKEIS